MSGIVELTQLLKSMQPQLAPGEWVFCCVQGDMADYVDLQPKAMFQEAEGLTLILAKSVAEKANIIFDGVFSQITLTVHSSLDAVGLTAAVAAKLTEKGISANVVAAYYHDHIFVKTSHAKQAVLALKALSLQS